MHKTDFGKKFTKSYFLSELINLMHGLEELTSNTIIGKGIIFLFMKFRKSSTYRFLKKAEKQEGISNGSKIINCSAILIHNVMNKVKLSFIAKSLAWVQDRFLEKPLFAILVIVLFAAIARYSLMLGFI
ncbi:hypothetical protein COV19_05395 [Candidatus Woesearchaeota archaeon CG10_big_fil_rev_8_21_14_0_10_44_13]|nr:MAG: hypothetical protein COV19_05395 [Candidatus Woesearchaeota archaeon CG10_big_fil_rev_8_21_14_0_10_44_13]